MEVAYDRVPNSRNCMTVFSQPTSKSLSLSFFLNLYLSLTCFLRCPCPVSSCEASFSTSQVSSYPPIKTTSVSQSENDANYYHDDTIKQARSVHRQNHRNCNNITAPVYIVFLDLSVHIAQSLVRN